MDVSKKYHGGGSAFDGQGPSIHGCGQEIGTMGLQHIPFNNSLADQGKKRQEGKTS